MTDIDLRGYYDESYPPSIYAPPTPIPATGATAGSPGAFTPAGATPPANLAAMAGIVATPATAWTAGQHVVMGDTNQVYWDGVAWSPGVGTVAARAVPTVSKVRYGIKGIGGQLPDLGATTELFVQMKGADSVQAIAYGSGLNDLLWPGGASLPPGSTITIGSFVFTTGPMSPQPGFYNLNTPVTTDAFPGVTGPLPLEYELKPVPTVVVKLPAAGDEPELVDPIPDPSTMNVTEVVTYAEANPEDAQALLDMERAGKNRSTLIAELQRLGAV